MYQLSLRTGTLAILSGVLALGTVACGGNNLVIPKSEATDTPQSAATPVPLPNPEPSVLPKASPPATDFYQQALDVATGAILISDDALSRDDWSLTANRWQEAIRLLKAVPTTSKDYSTAQNKIAQYQAAMAAAKAKAEPPPEPKYCSGDTNPQFLFVPIKRRLGGIPVVEVSFHDDHKFDMMLDTGASHTLITQSMATTLGLPMVGREFMQIADGSFVMLPIALAKSQEIDGRLMRDMKVGVAPSTMKMGLLGQDFLKGYDITIKENVVEFHRQPSTKATTKASKPCPVNTNPEFFSIPIKKRDKNRPVVELTFNDKYKSDLVFDTGATTTLITQSMATKLKLSLAGITQVGLADGSVTSLPLAFVESQKVNGYTKTDVIVAVAPPGKNIGLLGQDFYQGYNVTIKEKVIEFRRQ